MNTVLTELLASKTPAASRPFVLGLCKGEGGIDANAWLRCYGGEILNVPLTTVFNSENKLWAGKDNSHALGVGQFQPATYEEAALRTGLPTLEPQSQLANLYNHMGHLYGPSLEAELAAGKYLDVAAALAKTWTSLGNTGNVKANYATATAMLMAPGTDPVVASAPTPAPAPAPDTSDGDPELQAMVDMVADLSALSPAAQKRVLAYVVARFN